MPHTPIIYCNLSLNFPQKMLDQQEKTKVFYLKTGDKRAKVQLNYDLYYLSRMQVLEFK